MEAFGTRTLPASPFQPPLGSSPVQKERKGICDKAVLQLYFDKRYCVDSCNAGKELPMYLRVLADNFKADPNNQCGGMSNDHPVSCCFLKNQGVKRSRSQIQIIQF